MNTEDLEAILLNPSHYSIYLQAPKQGFQILEPLKKKKKKLLLFTWSLMSRPNLLRYKFTIPMQFPSRG